MLNSKSLKYKYCKFGVTESKDFLMLFKGYLKIFFSEALGVRLLFLKIFFSAIRLGACCNRPSQKCS